MKKEIERLQNIFGLRDWKITLIEDPAMSNLGECKNCYNRYESVITIASHLSKEEKIKAIVHEFTHILLRDTHEFLADITEDDNLRNMYIRLMEREVDRLAEGIYKLL